MISCGISPEYFLDKMSFDEINEVLKRQNESEKRDLEKLRLNWFHIYRAFGADIKQPEQIVRFEWEKKPVKKVSKKTIEKRKQQAATWLRKTTQ